MRYPVRLRVFLLCCLLMIGMNVMLIIGAIAFAGSGNGGMGSLPVCDAAFQLWERPAGRPGKH
jgi:hypothetical protein